MQPRRDKLILTHFVKNSKHLAEFFYKCNLLCLFIECGVPDSHFSSKVVHGRIVGGSSMVPGESPWTAALVKRNSIRPYCGATLINNRFLLTAAHCVLR